MRQFNLELIKHTIANPNTFNFTGDSFIDNRYEIHNLEFGHHWSYYRLFYHLSGLLQPNLVVELGGWQGTAAAHFASGLAGGVVVTIDHHTDPGDEVHKALMEEAANRYPNLIYVQGWTTEKLANNQRGKHALGDAPNAYPKVVETKKKIDILFIDSWHRYDEAMDDWQTYEPLLASPSLVICDDIQEGGDENSPIYGMYEFWKELPGEKFLDGTIHPGSNMGFIKYVK